MCINTDRHYDRVRSNVMGGGQAGGEGVKFAEK